MTSYHSIALSEVFSSLDTNDDGLSAAEAEKRLVEAGKNSLPTERGVPFLRILSRQFANSFIVLLLIAAGLSFLLDDMVEGIAILSIICINAFLGFYQEANAERAMSALAKISAPMARVVRGGKETKIPAADVVPGDLLVLEAGDIVAADARLVSVESLQVEEASLTGESVPSSKTTNQLPAQSKVPDQHNMVFMGTTVTYGKGTAIVVATGISTELGKIARSLQETVEEKTPLQIRFGQLSKQIGYVAIGLIFFVLIAGTIHGELSFVRMVIFSLALIVATVPESLPVIVTVSLSLGAKRLAKKNMLIRKLPAAESLGAATYICSDKTGTLTQNQMTVTSLYMDHRVVDVTGTGYVPEGEFSSDGKKIDAKDIHLLLKISTLCNNAQLVEESARYSVIGDPTEGSLIVLSKKGTVHKEHLHKSHTLVKELPFDSDRKLMSVIYLHHETKKTEAYVKGAPDVLLGRCTHIIDHENVRPLTASDRKSIMAAHDSFAGKALRVLGVAYRDVTHVTERTIKTIEQEMVFVGLVGMIDPARSEVPAAIAACEEAGISVMVITGDHPLTAQAVASQIGLFKAGDVMITGEELEAMSDIALEERIEQIRIVARALPIQKLRIVEMLQKKGHIVAMTGDGVNDAPALKKANIGIAMGITGTEVSKAVADAVLVDDNFATIVNAIAEGRNIYTKMIKSATYLLGCNAGEIVSVLLAILWALPLPLLPLQLLLMNVLTDDFPAMGLAVEQAENGVMKDKPRRTSDNPISSRLFLLITVFGLVMGLGTLFVFLQYLHVGLEKAQTMAFTTLVMFQSFVVVSCRFFERGFKQYHLLSNPWLLIAILFSLMIQAAVVYLPPLQNVFGTVALSSVEWIEITLVSVCGFFLMEALKWFILPKNTAKRMLP